MEKTGKKELKVIQQSLKAQRGPQYWRSLEEWSQSEAFQDLIQQEFPQLTGEKTKIHRRRFLQLMGASLALAGLGGCATGPPQEQILPYTQQPEGTVQGVPLYFATAMPLSGYGSGLLVKSYMGRPIKVEGNPDHPALPKPVHQPQQIAFGPTHLFAQASLLTMYDPNRSQTVKHRGNISTWEEFTLALSAAVEDRERVKLRLLTSTVTSPTLARQIQMILDRFPQARWHVHEPVHQDNARIGARYAFGEDVQVRYDLSKADVIVSLEDDFLDGGPEYLRYVQEFTNRRRGRSSTQRGEMNRLYVVESTSTLTGSKADHRLPLRASQIESFARVLASRLGIDEAGGDLPSGVSSEWMNALVADLRSPDAERRGRCVVMAGKSQPPYVHALALKINEVLGNLGETVLVSALVEFRNQGAEERKQAHSLNDLTEAMADENVEVLLLLGSNPVYTAPADLEFAEKLSRVPFRAHLNLYDDETSGYCHWHIPETHYLESWGDVCSFDGTVSLIQPLIAPLYQGKSTYEVLALLTGQPEESNHAVVRSHWRDYFTNSSENFEQWWQRALHNGYVAGTRLSHLSLNIPGSWSDAPSFSLSNEEGLEIIFRPDPTLYDGQFANNGWLQELPEPLSKITWGNAAWMSPATAVRLGLASSENPQEANQKLVELRYQGRTLEAPVWVIPGHADETITLPLGYGRQRAGQVGTDVGFNAYRLRTLSAPWFDQGLQVRDLQRSDQLATTQHHQLMENRHLIWESSVEEQEFERLLEDMQEHHHPLPSLYPEQESTGNQWGMAIDLGACTGCGACMVACQAENNIPVVGKEEVVRGREMHWIRVDTYYSGDPDHANQIKRYHQPVPCMHCENAPCEVVCPVEATVHSHDGLNDMVYNRCVGTRYCSNNCPYKVRRFNYFQYADFATELFRLMRNPEVTVRERGVMEKCTYCVQRIRTSEITARGEDRPLRDGEIQTACQAVCPASAIVFGDVQNRNSQVSHWKRAEINYGLLEEQNTRPRTSYLAALRNPNPAIVQMEEAK